MAKTARQLPRIEWFPGPSGARWRMKAANGEIVCTGQAHRDLSDVKRAVRRVRELMRGRLEFVYRRRTRA
jgi:hypothetical protein